MMEVVTEAWCDSYLDIERVFLSILALFSIKINQGEEDETGRSFNERVLKKFDAEGSPLNELLGHHDGCLPVAQFFWSETWKAAIGEEDTMMGRNLTRDSIDQLRLFKEWWPTCQDFANPAPEFLGSRIAPPENYEVWFGGVFDDLVSAFEICHKVEVKKLDQLVITKEQMGPKSLNKGKGRVSSSTVKGQVGNSKSAPPEHPAPDTTTKLAASRSLTPEMLGLRKDLFIANRDLRRTLNQRDGARSDRDWLRERLESIQKEFSDYKASQESRLAQALEDKAEEIWGDVQENLARGELFEFMRGMSLGRR